jgi:hypothetical protein
MPPAMKTWPAAPEGGRLIALPVALRLLRSEGLAPD